MRYRGDTTGAVLSSQNSLSHGTAHLPFGGNQPRERASGVIDGQVQLWSSAHLASERLRTIFGGSGRMLVRAPWSSRSTHARSRFRWPRRESCVPTHPATPSGEAHVHRLPSSERLRQVAPRAAGPANSDRFDKPAIVGRRSSWAAFLAR